MSTAGLLAVEAGVVFILVTALWAVSVAVRDTSIVDIFWGSGFVVVAWVAFALCGLASAGCSEGTLLDSADNHGASLVVSPAEPQTIVGGRLKLTAIAVDQQGAPTGPIEVRWESRDTSVATISTNGEVVGRRPGHTVLVATSATDRREVELVVAPGLLGSLEIVPGTGSVAVGRRESTRT